MAYGQTSYGVRPVIHYKSTRSLSPTFFDFLGEPLTPSLPPSPHTQVLIYGPAIQMERWTSAPVGYPTFRSNCDRFLTLTTGFGLERSNLCSVEQS
ncbi:hypothetical protein AVEN_262232-1 [Araneus ventricosus]|uniref:Uncharacterized protein n=1 Tax=Araneus ventricosus TaxID=182803 RepID=A0A4Y2PKU5_ARAVE|nr:hypothetical protein AVEN_262232-1 [Araneus ventricosus]